MNPLLNFLQEIYQRLVAKSPKFFVVWQWLTGAVAAVTGIPGVLQMLSITLPAPFNLLVNKAVTVAAGFMWLMAKLPVQDINATTKTGETKFPITNISKIVSIFLICVLASTLSNAQSVLRKQPKLKHTATLSFAHTLTIPDSVTTVNAFRFGVVVPAYAITPSNSFTNAQVMAGGEFGYKHESYNYNTSVYTTLWSANIAWFALNSATPPTSISGIQTFALLAGFDNDLIQVGPLYNPQAPTGQKIGLAVSVGIALH